MPNGSKKGINKKLFLILLFIISFNRSVFSQVQGHRIHNQADSLDIVTNHCDFENDTFPDGVNFNNCIFNREALFYHAIFENHGKIDYLNKYSDVDFNYNYGAARFAGSKFLIAADFAYARFYNDAYFTTSEFDRSAFFHGTTFFYNADFSQATFSGITRFDGATFSHEANFNRVNFSKDAEFYSVIFSNNSNFVGTKFSKAVDFSHAKFAKNIGFVYAEFSNVAHFTDLQLTDSTNFYMAETILPDTVDFSNNLKLPCEIDLSASNFESKGRYDSTGKIPYKKHKIYLYRTDISKIHFDYIHFQLIFDIADDYFHNKLPDDEKEIIYEGALKNFKDRGQLESYENLNREYQQFLFNRLPLLDKLWTYFSSSFSRAIEFIGIFLLLFSLINLFPYKKKSIYKWLNDEVYKLPNFTLNNPKISVVKYFLKNFTNSLVYTAVIFFAFSINLERLNYDKRAFLFWFLFIYAIGLLTIFAVAHVVVK